MAEIERISFVSEIATLAAGMALGDGRGCGYAHAPDAHPAST
jgi:hypothetical protein